MTTERCAICGSLGHAVVFFTPGQFQELSLLDGELACKDCWSECPACRARTRFVRRMEALSDEIRQGFDEERGRILSSLADAVALVDSDDFDSDIMALVPARSRNDGTSRGYPLAISFAEAMKHAKDGPDFTEWIAEKVGAVAKDALGYGRCTCEDA